MRGYCLEFRHVNGIILLLSKMILIVPSISSALLVVVVIGCYVFDIFVLPIRTAEFMMAELVPSSTNDTLQKVICCITDIIGFVLSSFLGVTYASNYSGILHLFITDAIGKLKQ